MATITDVYGNELNVYKDDECNTEAQELTWQEVSEPMRTLFSIDDNYNVTFSDDLTLDEAKEMLRRMAMMSLKIQKAQMEMSRPAEVK